MINYKVISGGQTGVDRGALEGAKEVGIETGGYAPAHFLTERGSDKSLMSLGLIDSGLDYVGRTNLNARYSDGTIWIGKEDGAGYIATKRACAANGKLFIRHKSVDDTVRRIRLLKWTTINFAGSRESKSCGIEIEAHAIVRNIMNLLRATDIQTTIEGDHE